MKFLKKIVNNIKYKYPWEQYYKKDKKNKKSELKDAKQKRNEKMKLIYIWSIFRKMC